MNKFAYWMVVSIGWISLNSAGAFALPLGTGQEPGFFTAEASFAPAGTVDFTAIVALSNCSGSLVRFTNSLPTDPAMVLTNGHCLDGGFLPPGKVISNVPSKRVFRLLTPNGKGVLGAISATRIIYGTMTGTDMALYGLQETYDLIEKRFKVQALTISPAHPVAGRPITIASGYWRRIYTCRVDRFVHELREEQWIWNDSMRYTQPGCETIGGTSGSPIIDSETHEVVGVNNTGNESGSMCTMNNPCEVDETGSKKADLGASYGQQTWWLYTCLDSKNEVQLAKPGCLLPKNR